MIPDLDQRLEPRLQLGTLPTPIVRWPSFTGSSDVEVDLKRDDLIGHLVTGTKARALSFLVHRAIEDGVTDLITLGEPTSNQCRLVAILAARHGMRSHLLLRASAKVSEEDENLAILRLYKASMQLLAEDEWRLHGLVVKRLMSRIRKEGGKALFLPFGCGGLPGTLGIIDLFREILAAHDGRCPYSHIFVPTGSGSTLFGLDLAVQILGIDRPPRLVGVSVSQDEDSLLRQIDQLYGSATRALEHELGRSDRLLIDDGWRHLSSAELLEQLARVVDTYGFMPDPLYVLRSLLSLEQQLEQGDIQAPCRVLVLVSGACRTLQAMRSRAHESDHLV